MSETNETEGKAGRGGRKMTLNVRRTVESGHVRQSFSHGRSKSVLVEKKKRRAIGAGGAAQPADEPKAEAGATALPKPPLPDSKPRRRKDAASASCCRSSPKRRRMRACGRSPICVSARRSSARKPRAAQPSRS